MLQSTPMHARRTGLSLVELVVSMGLLSLIMLPVVGLLATSFKVYNAGCTSRDAGYARQVALDAIAFRIQAADRVINTTTTLLRLQLISGGTAELGFVNDAVTWTVGGKTEVLASGISDAKFSMGSAAGAAPTAGDLVRVEVASKVVTEPLEKWSSTTFWVHPML